MLSIANTLLVLGFIFIAIYGLRLLGNCYFIFTGRKLRKSDGTIIREISVWVGLFTVLETIAVLFFAVVYLFNWHWI